MGSKKKKKVLFKVEPKARSNNKAMRLTILFILGKLTRFSNKTNETIVVKQEAKHKKGEHVQRIHLFAEPIARLELATYALRMRCSTN